MPKYRVKYSGMIILSDSDRISPVQLSRALFPDKFSGFNDLPEADFDELEDAQKYRNSMWEQYKVYVDGIIQYE